MPHLFRCSPRAKAVIRAWAKHRFEAALLGPCRRGTVHRRHPEVISFVKEQRTELRLADTRRILQHGPEHGSSSPGELEMTWSTSEVAVCCCSDSRSSLSRRVFSMAMTACVAKFSTNAICLSVNGRTS